MAINLCFTFLFCRTPLPSTRAASFQYMWPDFPWFFYGTAEKLQIHLSNRFINRTLAVSCFILLLYCIPIGHQHSMNPFQAQITSYLTLPSYGTACDVCGFLRAFLHHYIACIILLLWGNVCKYRGRYWVGRILIESLAEIQQPFLI
jgi:hypothetical protein